MNSTIKSAHRTLAIFEYFARRQERATVMEIAHELKIPHSSASVLIKSLVSLGYLDQDKKTRTYHPTISISLLGSWLNQRYVAPGMLPSLVQELAKETNEIVGIAMRNDIYAQIVFAQSPEKQYHVGGGVMAPLVCSAAGWCFLSQLPDAEIGRLVRRTKLETPVSRWRTSADDAIENVQQTKNNGYAISNNHARRDWSGIAILLPGFANLPRLAVSVGGPTESIHQKKELIVQNLHKFAEGVDPAAVRDLLFHRKEAPDFSTDPDAS